MAKATRTARFLGALERGRSLTVEQIRDQFGFGSNQSVTATVSNLKRAGHNIEHFRSPRDGRFGRYRIVKTTRKVA